MTNIHTPRGTGKKILIVEDSKSYLFILSQSFMSEGFSVATAEDGEQGLVAVKEENPDLILLDIEMPKMDGITVAKKLRELNVQTPIIFLTNVSDLKRVSEAIENATDYIVKSDLSVEGIIDKVKEKLKLK